MTKNAPDIQNELKTKNNKELLDLYCINRGNAEYTKISTALSDIDTIENEIQIIQERVGYLNEQIKSMITGRKSEDLKDKMLEINNSIEKIAQEYELEPIQKEMKFRLRNANQSFIKALANEYKSNIFIQDFVDNLEKEHLGQNKDPRITSSLIFVKQKFQEEQNNYLNKQKNIRDYTNVFEQETIASDRVGDLQLDRESGATKSSDTSTKNSLISSQRSDESSDIDKAENVTDEMRVEWDSAFRDEFQKDPNYSETLAPKATPKQTVLSNYDPNKTKVVGGSSNGGGRGSSK
ncbi:MAG: hypothetical protein SFT91_05140 [Rickettsiaceae bacterium]|nr:hypothetical protein [Rickettsiaceae bacterium]